MKRLLVAVLAVIAVSAFVLADYVQAREEVKLTTIIPDQTILRVKKGVVSPTRYKPAGATGLPDNQMNDGNLLVDGDVGVGMNPATTPKTKTGQRGFVDTKDVWLRDANAGAGAWASAAGGGLVQVVTYQTGAVITSTNAIPYDDSIPQITEGFEVMSVTITPKSATNKLKIDVVALATNDAGDAMTAALFKTGTNGALAASGGPSVSTSMYLPLIFTHYVVAGTTNPIIFKVRLGCSSGWTTTFNGSCDGIRKLGGALASSITVTEISANTTINGV